MRKNKKKIIVLVIISMTFSCLFLLYPINDACAIGAPSTQDMGEGGVFYDPTTGKMTTAEEKAKELNQMYPPSGSSAYFNQEKIPGAASTKDFADYIKQIIRFGFATIGILALFMLSVGAYQYLMAAGNLAKIESAKETIYSALFGLILGLTSFLILRTINPQLVSLQLTSPGGGTGQAGISGDKGTNYGSGNCVEVGSGPCSPESLASTFGSAANQASIICNVESAGNPMKASKSDLCQDGRSFSWGLFQINLTVHKIGGLDCPSAFSGKNSSCTVTNESLYQQCVQAAQNSTTNTSFAKGLYSKNGWSDWLKSRQKCGL